MFPEGTTVVKIRITNAGILKILIIQGADNNPFLLMLFNPDFFSFTPEKF